MGARSTADLERKQSGERGQGTQQLAIDVLAALDQAYELDIGGLPYAAEAEDILTCAKYAFEQQLILDAAVQDAEDAAETLQLAIAELDQAQAAYNEAFAVFADAETELEQAKADYIALVASGTATDAELALALARIALAQTARDHADLIGAAAALALDEAKTAKADAETAAILAAAIPGVDDDPATSGTDESTLLYKGFNDALRLLELAEEADRTARAADAAKAADDQLKDDASQIDSLLQKLNDATEAVYGEDGLQGIVNLAMAQYLDSASGADSATAAYILALYTVAYLKYNGASDTEIADAEAVLIAKTAEYYQKSNPDVAAIAEKEIEKNLAALADAISARDRALDVVYDLRAQIDALMEETAALNAGDAYKNQQQAAADALTDYYANEEAYVKAAEAARLAQEAYDAANQAREDAVNAAVPNAATVANTAIALAEADTALNEANNLLSAALTARDDALSAYNSAMRNGTDGMQDITEAAAADALNAAIGAKVALTTNALYASATANDTTGHDYAPGDAASEDPTVQVGGDAVIVSGGGVSGAGDGSLSINVGGVLTIDAEGDVNLSSTDSLHINTIMVGAGTNADVLTVGNITGSGNPAIKAENIALYALDLNGSGADISGNSPLMLDANTLTIIANNVSVWNRGDTELGNVIVAGAAVIQSGGNVTQTSGTTVRASDLTILAAGDITGGSVYNVYESGEGNLYYQDQGGRMYTRDNGGTLAELTLHAPAGLTDTGRTYKDALIVFADTLTASGADINIANRKTALMVLLVTGNNVVLSGSGGIRTYPNTGIISGAGSIMVTALGNIGSPDNYVRVSSNGPIYIDDASSAYGLVYFLRIFGKAEPVGPSTLVDDPSETGYYMLDENGIPQRHDRPGTGMELTGYFSDDAYLWVGTREETAAIKGAAEHTIHVRITDGDVVLFDYDIRIDCIIGYVNDPTTGKRLPVIELDKTGKNAGLFMLFRLFIGAEYNGRTFLVSYTLNGRAYETRYTVSGGYLVFTLRNIACDILVTLDQNL